MTPRITHVIAALALTTPAVLLAQQEASIGPGHRVRASAPSISANWVVGTVLEVRTDTCFLAVEGHASPYSLPFTSIRRLEISRGERTSSSKGARIGALAGAALGLLVGVEIGTTEHERASCADLEYSLFECRPETKTDLAVVGAFTVGLGGLGAATGALIGFASKSERWDVVPLDELRVGRSPVTRDGVAVSVSLRL